MGGTCGNADLGGQEEFLHWKLEHEYAYFLALCEGILSKFKHFGFVAESVFGCLVLTAKHLT